ncbi:MAG: potassium channel family protein [Thermoanaerobaculia bacterium]
MQSRSHRRSSRWTIDERNRPLVIATLLMFNIFVVGVTGYLVIGSPHHGFIDALYMTVITLTTVGYGEVIDLSGHPAGRLFTIALLFSGVGTFLYFFSSLTGFIVEGNLERIFWRRRMEKSIEGLQDHYIVCGAGHTGEHIVRELHATGRPFVLIERLDARVKELHEQLGVSFPAIVGDSTHDDVLLAAGIERAAGLFASISNDKDNLIITISARLVSPTLRIVSRCTDEGLERKIRRAGADVVVSPTAIGGLRMTSEMVRPTVVSFLDVMLRDTESLRVEESTVAAASSLDGMTAGEFRKRAPERALLVAVRSAEGEWLYNPPDDAKLLGSSTLVYIGNRDARRAIDVLASTHDPHRWSAHRGS